MVASRMRPIRKNTMANYFFLKKQTRRVQPRGARPASSPFHAVSLHGGTCACDGVRELKARKFLSNEAPALPLQGCSSRNCNCRYVHHEDRRSGENRREQHRAAGATGPGRANRRSQPERRRAAEKHLAGADDRGWTFLAR
jgi:hypothetical protein